MFLFSLIPQQYITVFIEILKYLFSTKDKSNCILILNGQQYICHVWQFEKCFIGKVKKCEFYWKR